MTREWRIKHTDARGTAKATITVSDKLARITEPTVDAWGGCQDARLTCLVRENNIAGLDQMQLQYREVAGTGNWLNLYAGEIDVPGIPTSFANSEVKLVGLRRILEKVRLVYPTYSSDSAPMDIAAVMNQMVSDLVSSGVTGSVFLGVSDPIPETGVSYSSIPFSFGVTVPKITVNGLRFAQFMDLLCTLLPGLHWGVNADRKIFANYTNPFDSYLGTLSVLNATVAAVMNQKNQVQASITGSFNADIMLEAGSDGITYGTVIPLVNMITKASATYVSNPGEYIADTTGFAYVRLRITTYNWGYVGINMTIARVLKLTEGVDNCIPTFKPATFEKICNVVDFLLTVPNSNEVVPYVVKDQVSIDKWGERALSNVLGYSDVITEIPLADITYGYSPNMNPVNSNYSLAGTFVQSSKYKFDSTTGGATWSNSVFFDKLEGTNYNGLACNFTFTYIGTPLAIPADGYPTVLSIYLSAVNVGLIRVQAQMDGTEPLYKSMYIESVASPYVTNPSTRKTFFSHQASNPPYITSAQFVRVDPSFGTHVLYAENAHYPGQTALVSQFFVSQFKPYKFNVTLLENIAHSYFNTPNADAATVKVNKMIPVLSLPFPDVRLNTNLNGIKAAKPKLFKYIWDSKDFAITAIEFEQAENATSTTVASLISSKDSKSIANANSFTINSGKSIPSVIISKFGSGMQFHPISPSSTGSGAAALVGTWTSGTGSNGEFGVDKTVGYSGANISWAALKDIPPGTLIRLSCLVRAKSFGNAALWLSDTSVSVLTEFYTVAEVFADVAGYFKRDVNSFDVLLDENGFFKLNAYAANGASGNAMEYYLYLNGVWSPLNV